MCSTLVWVKGPRYLPLENSLFTISLKISLCSSMEGLLEGAKVCDRGGMFAEEPKCRPSYMFKYWVVRLAVESHLHHALDLWG